MSVIWSFVISVVYAENKTEERRLLGKKMVQLKQQITSQAWLVMGDFNVIRYSYEKIGGVEGEVAAIADLEKCLQEFDVDDVPYKGTPLIWFNGRHGDARIYYKLDRILCNVAWYSLFQQFEVEFLDRLVSDHNPGNVIVREEFKIGPKQFKFRSLFMRNEHFEELLNQAWQSEQKGNPVL